MKFLIDLMMLIYSTKKKISIICLGKLGFEELNASSDIDVVFLYLDNNVNNKLFEILKNFFTEISRT